MIAIKLTDVINEIERFKGYLDEDMMLRIKIAINRLPTIDAEPVKHGKWIEEAEDWRHQIEYFKCSHCGFPTSTAYNYCPNCGAKTDEEEL